MFKKWKVLIKSSYDEIKDFGLDQSVMYLWCAQISRIYLWMSMHNYNTGKSGLSHIYTQLHAQGRVQVNHKWTCYNLYMPLVTYNKLSKLCETQNHNWTIFITLQVHIWYYSIVELPNQKIKIVFIWHWNLRTYLSRIWKHSLHIKLEFKNIPE